MAAKSTLKALQSLNSPRQLRGAWSTLKPSVTDAELVDRIDVALGFVLNQLASVTGNLVSDIVTQYLTATYPGELLRSNSKSDYPDLYLSSSDYSALPRHRRSGVEIGASVKGDAARPARVPDGLEIKTARGRAGVDCHFPHLGLHLLIEFDEQDDGFHVSDISAAFLAKSDYRIAKRNTEATTVKASFGRTRFVSLLRT